MDMKRRISKRKTAPVAEDFKKQNRAKRKRLQDKIDIEFDEPVFVSASGEPVDLSKTHSTVLHMVNQTRLPLNSRERKKILAAAPKKENEEELMESLRKKRKTGTTVEQAVEIDSSSGDDEEIKPPKVIPIAEPPKEKTKSQKENKKKAKHTKFVSPVTNLELRPDSPETPPPTPLSALEKLVIPTEFSRKMNGRYFLQTETPSPGGLAENKPTKLTLGTKDNFHKTCSACASEDHDIFGCRNMFCTNCTEKGHRATDCPLKKRKSSKCDWCGKAGHAETNCPVKQYLITEDDVKDARCLVCGQVGHLDCGKPRKNLKKIFCFNCGEKHLGLECEKPSFTDMLEAELQESQSRGREKRTDIRSRQTEFFIREFLLNSN